MKRIGNIFRPYVVIGLLMIVFTFGIWVYIGAQSLDITEPFNRDDEVMRLYKEVTHQKQRAINIGNTRGEQYYTRFVEFTRLQIELLNSMDPR